MGPLLYTHLILTITRTGGCENGELKISFTDNEAIEVYDLYKGIKMKSLRKYAIALAVFSLVACNSGEAPIEAEQDAPASEKIQMTVVTDENYGLAESEIIFSDYVSRIAAATGTNGMGQWLHLREGADPKDRTVMRINFDTIYSFMILDLTEPAILTMPETDGRYQSAWIITDEHYNPMAFVEPGRYVLTQDNVGRRYALVIMRTQVDVMNPDDLAIVHEIQDQLKTEQKDRGAFAPSGNRNMEDVLAMRAKYAKIGQDEGMTSEQLFGKKTELPLKEHNVGAAMGWGGFTPERAVYPTIFPDSTAPQTLTLEDVPAGAFWSVTVYDAEGYPQGNSYNINSAFAVANEDGSYTIRFGGDENAVNFMDVFKGWNITLRIYEPTEAYFSGEWLMPQLELVD